MKNYDLWKLQIQSFERIFKNFILPRPDSLQPDNDNQRPEGQKDDDDSVE